MTCDPLAGVQGGFGPETQLRVGSWNISHWSVPKVQLAALEIPADILALQETHLSSLPLEWAHTSARNLGLHLHHGRPVQTARGETFGRSCGVGFVTMQGIAVSPVLPVGSAWRLLHALGRLHAVRLPPRAGLPRGLLLVSIYAPLQQLSSTVERLRFTNALLEVTHTLDMQVPTLLLGDFNGSVCPERDFRGASGRSRPACPLLAQLLGPGGAWIDVHVAMLPAPLPWTFQSVDSNDRLSASRIDLVLANQAAVSLITSASVFSNIRDGGHSPVIVHLRLHSSVAINWKRPLPRLPPLLHLSSVELLASPVWTALVDSWLASSPVRSLLAGLALNSLEVLSSALHSALLHLVTLAGGWSARPPCRRAAYDSSGLRSARRRLAVLLHFDSLIHQAPGQGAVPGSWPLSWLQQLERVGSINIDPSATTVPALRAALSLAIRRCRDAVDLLNCKMRSERHARWRDQLPQLWRDRPGVIYHWLHAAGAPWGSTPILDESGLQCTTAVAVDAAVRAYWVDSVLRQHASVDPAAAWAKFLASQFGAFIPVSTWPTSAWTGDRVRAVLRRMREGAAPGMAGVPIAVWRALPDLWMTAVARLLTLVEAAGVWPTEWLDAYVAMIPKSSGGTRPRDQRPITVLEVVYRIWSKGVVLEWSPTLQHEFLGQSAMGFRAQSGTLHVAQLLSDLIILQRKRRAQLWLASFDIEKCFDSLPWWAVFNILRRAGVRPEVVNCFAAFYRDLRRRFRYGQVDGAVWAARNGLAQGCPASPDLLNILFEPFHRWAAAQHLGVEVADFQVPSVSFADDLALAARSLPECERLIGAYLEWCSLLGLRVTKVQVWSNVGGRRQVQVAGAVVDTMPTFKIVGIVLGQDEMLASRLHIAPRLTTALATTQRLRVLDLPSSLLSQLWRTTVLPQALYGCEIRDVRPSALIPLASAGKAAIANRFPIRLNVWRAAEVLTGPALGDSAVLDPLFVVRHRQLRWLQLLVNLNGLVGTVHRALVSPTAVWAEPSAALSAALRAVNWSLQRNDTCQRSSHWPHIAPEPRFLGRVELQPQDTFPAVDAVFTDGSLSSAGGAAATRALTDDFLQLHLPAARSSTHCELAALCLALRLQPSEIYSDSLVSLQLIRGWGTWPAARMLNSVDRLEVRQFLAEVALSGLPPPMLCKVKAHDERGVAIGHPQAVGNDVADLWAKRAAADASIDDWQPQCSLYGDPVELRDAAGTWVSSARDTFPSCWWQLRSANSSSRAWLRLLYPADLALDWQSSAGIFRRPTCSGGSFVHSANPAVIKWIARVRAGSLNTRLRLHKRRMVGSSSCPCCDAEEEDDEHVIAGCPATGTADWPAMLCEVWDITARAIGVAIPSPEPEWLSCHRLQLLAALIPQSIAGQVPLPAASAARFRQRLHRELAGATAECLRRRQALIAAATPDADTTAPAASAATQRPCPLSVDRQLSVHALRQLEIQRRASSSLPVPTAPASDSPAPASGTHRQLWLRRRLERLLNEDTIVCLPSVGSTAVVILELFERVTGEAFTESPGQPITSRVRAIGKVMGNITREATVVPPLTTSRKVQHAGSFVMWSRRPVVCTDVVAWRRRVESREAYQVPSTPTRDVMSAADAGLAAWLRGHRHLRPVEPAAGESGMALLLLWEVDHNQPYPTRGSSTPAALLLGFTRRLKRRVDADPELSNWMTSTPMQCPLAPGVAPSHHIRWSVTIMPPSPEEAQGWYTEFRRRWLEFLATQALPAGVRAGARLSAPSQREAPQATFEDIATSSASGPALPQTARHIRCTRPPTAAGPLAKRRKAVVPEGPQEPVSLASQAQLASPGTAPGVTAAPSISPPRKRLRGQDLSRWLVPRVPAAPQPSSPPPTTEAPGRLPPPPPAPVTHDRATMGPPT